MLPADLLEAEERLRASVSTGAKLELGDRVPGRNGRRCPSRKKIRAEVIAALLKAGNEVPGGAVLWVEGACIVGTLDLRYARLDTPLIMKHCCFDGGIDLSAAHTASVVLGGSRFAWFHGYGLRVDGDADWSRCQGGQLDIFGARIGGRLWLAGAELGGTGSGFALNAPDLAVEGGLYCRGMKAAGGINLYGATIGATFELNHAVLTSHAGPALRAPGLSVKSDMDCGTGFTATGAIDMFGAQIGGQLWLNSATLDRGASDRALDAPQISVNGGLYCNGRFHASGMINLFGAAVGAGVEFSGASLSNPAGKCLRAPGMTVGDSLSLIAGFSASGEIDLARVRISGELHLAETLVADSALDLRGANVGQLNAEPASLPDRLHLDGLTYAALQPYLPAAERLEILRRDQGRYQPQPYEQLAASYRSLGHDEQARIVLLAKQRRRRQDTKMPAKAWGYLQDAAIGYGYRPARALVWLTALIALTAAYFTVFPPHVSTAGHPPLPPIIYAFYLVVPILNIGQPAPYPADAPGQWLIWIVQVTGWILATTVIAGATRVLSRG
jgi:hypothetical protein